MGKAELKPFGPSNLLLNVFCQELLKHTARKLPLSLQDSFIAIVQLAAEGHDLAYTGTSRRGFFGFALDFVTRREADKKMFKVIKAWITTNKLILNKQEHKTATEFNNAVHLVLRLSGRTFFRTKE